MAIFGLGELVFLVIEVIGNLLFGKRRKRLPPNELPTASEAHTVSAPTPSLRNE